MPTLTKCEFKQSLINKIMKIGILSMQMVSNYGSYLQAYALKSIIESFGHKCYFIEPQKDINIPTLRRSIMFYIRKSYERFFAHDIYSRIKYYCLFYKRFNNFKKELAPTGSLENKYNIVIIGSDEVFNCFQSAPWCFSSSLFGHIPNAEKIISYAGSFGHTTINDINKNEQIKSLIQQGFSKMSHISVRDQNSLDIIFELTGKNPEFHIDPVLLYNYDTIVPDKIPDQDYILIYSYPNRINNKHEIQAIQEFAKLKQKKLISIGFYFPWCNKTVIPHPFDVLAYFQHADYIITDTFHGTIMSIKYNKQFVTLIRKSNKHKLLSLLDQFDLNKRAINDVHDLNCLLTTHIDYTNVNKKIQTEQNKATQYLHTTLL